MSYRSYLLSTASEAALGLDRYWIPRVALRIMQMTYYITFFATKRGLGRRQDLTAYPAANEGDEPSPPLEGTTQP